MIGLITPAQPSQRRFSRRCGAKVELTQWIDRNIGFTKVDTNIFTFNGQWINRFCGLARNKR
jgi:hypothetical protein